MNLVFAVIIIFSTLLLILINPSLVLPALSDSSVKAVELSLKLLSIYAIWMGILKLCEVTGISKKLERMLRPLIRLLYGDISPVAMEYISINMAANILGMGNAATPAAINAVNALDEGKSVANYAMIMLVVVNATSLQLLPTSVISLRQTFHSANASDIIVPSLIASLASTLFGIFAVMLLCRKREGAAAKERKKSRKAARKRDSLPAVKA